MTGGGGREVGDGGYSAFPASAVVSGAGRPRRAMFVFATEGRVAVVLCLWRHPVNAKRRQLSHDRGIRGAGHL